MIKYIVTALAALTIASAAQAQSGTEWNNPVQTSVNREKARTKFMSYDRREDAETYDFEKSPFYLPLKSWSIDGREAAVPGYFSQSNAKELGALQPPMLPAENPSATYTTRFEIPVLWLDRDIFLHIGAASEGYYVKVNGLMVGYTEDSAMPAEFNIAKYVKDGVNTLEVEVKKWTTGSWLENDIIAGAGIAGNTYIYSQPKIHIDDFTIRTSFDSTYTHATLEIKIAAVNNFNGEESATIYFDLMNEKGEILRYNYADVTMPGMGGRDTVCFIASVPNTAKWSTDTPDHYKFMFRTRTDGRFAEYVPYYTGIRSLEMKNGKYMMNGKPLMIKGVNYTYSPETADAAGIKKYLNMLKRNNVNAIRVGYHPDRNLLYELCNQQGIMVCDQANINTSLTGEKLDVGGTLSNVPQWLPAYTSRIDNVYGLSRNFPAAVLFSLGRDAGNGYNMYKTYEYAKTIDSLRPVIYDGAANLWNTDAYFAKDPTAEQIAKWGAGDDTRLMFASDFTLDDKNAKKFAEAWYGTPRFQGGFYNGNPDNEELRTLYGNIRFETVDVKKGSFRVTNFYGDRNLNTFAISYTVTEGSRTLRTGVLPLTVAPDGSRVFTIPLGALAKAGNTLTFTVKTKVKDAVYPAGYVVAKQEISL